MKDNKGNYNLYFHENPIFNRMDYDPNNFSHTQIHAHRQMPSYWSKEALNKYDKFLNILGRTIADPDIFIMNTTGIAGEYFMIHFPYFYSEDTISHFQGFIKKKYKNNIDNYNFLNKKKYKNFSEIIYDTSYCDVDLFEWYMSSIKERIKKETIILKKYNPTNEQYINNFHGRGMSQNFFETFYTCFDPFYIWRQIKEELNLDKISTFKMVLHDDPPIIWHQLENVIEARKNNIVLWSGAEGPENIVKNTRSAILFGQRGFLCGLSETIHYPNLKLRQLDKKYLNNISQSIKLWKKYYPIYQEIDEKHAKYEY
jgi:hypothetical protein